MQVYDVGIIIFLWVKEFQMLINWEVEAKKVLPKLTGFGVIKNTIFVKQILNIWYVSGSKRS